MIVFGRTLVTRAVPRRMAAGPAPTRVAGCNCGATPLAAHVLRALGVTTVHPSGSDAAVWRAHIAQERLGLIPALRAIGQTAAAAALDADHAVYLKLLAAEQPLPPWPGSLHSIADHSALEDRLAETHAAALLAWARAHGTDAAGPAVGAPLAGYTMAPGHAAAPSALATAQRPKTAWWPWMLAGGAAIAGGYLFVDGYRLWGLALGLGTGGALALATHDNSSATISGPLPPAADIDHPGGAPTPDNTPDPTAIATVPDVNVLINGVDADAAASAALDADSQAALHAQNAEAKAQYKGMLKKYGDYFGVGDAANSWGGFLVDVALGIGNAIKVFAGDPSADANTDYEKARLRDAMSIMISLGFPPGSLGFEMWGAQDLANELEEEIRVVKGVNWKTGCKTMTIVRPEFGSTAVDYSPVLRELGRSIIVAINNKNYGSRAMSAFMESAKRVGGMLYNRYSPLPTASPDGKFNSAYMVRTADNLLPSEALVAYAGSARFGIPDATARGIVADSINRFADRWHVHMPTIDGDNPVLRCNLVAFRMVDAWQRLTGYAASHGLYDGARWAARDYEPVVS